MTTRRARIPAGLLALAFLGGCAEAELAGHLAALNAPESRPGYHVGEPYERAGRRVVPAEDFALVETGLASWYGPGLHGRRTANGEIFDMNALTAAHPSLQLPAIALVTNLDNGRTVRLRINDRGPVAGDRILDVSRRVAELLGFKRQGVARVRLRVLAEESLALRTALTGRPARATLADAGAAPGAGRSAPPAAMAEAATGDPADHARPALWIDAATFRDRQAADTVRRRAAALAPARLDPVRVDGADYWQVRLGPFANRPAAQEALAGVWRAGLADARLAP